MTQQKTCSGSNGGAGFLSCARRSFGLRRVFISRAEPANRFHLKEYVKMIKDVYRGIEFAFHDTKDPFYWKCDGSVKELRNQFAAHAQD